MRILRGLLASLLFALIILGINSIASFLTLNNKNFYIKSLEKSNIYKESPKLISDFISLSVQNAIEAKVENEVGVSSQSLDITSLQKELNPLIENSIGTIVTPQLLQNTVDTNIENILNFFKSTDKNLKIYIPRDEVISQLKSESPQIEQNIKNTINKFPQCTAEELNNIQNSFETQQKVSINCIPEDIKKEVLNNENFEFSQNLDTFIVKLENENPEFTKNEITLDELIDLSKDENFSNTQKETLKSNIQQKTDIIQKGYGLWKLSVITLWSSIILLLIVYLLISNGSLLQKLKSTLKIPFTASLLNLIPFLVIKFLLLDRLINETTIETAFDDNSEISINSITLLMKLLREFINNYISPIILISGVICLSTLILIIILKLLTVERSSSSVEVKNIE